MAYQLGALGAIKTPELVKMSKPTSGNYSQLFGQMNRNQQALGQREDRATLNALGSARAEAIMDGQGGSAELQGIREAQTKALDAQDIPLYDKLTGDLKAQMQIESAEAKADPFGKNQLGRDRLAQSQKKGRELPLIEQAVRDQTSAKENALNILDEYFNIEGDKSKEVKSQFRQRYMDEWRKQKDAMATLSRYSDSSSHNFQKLDEWSKAIAGGAKDRSAEAITDATIEKLMVEANMTRQEAEGYAKKLAMEEKKTEQDLQFKREDQARKAKKFREDSELAKIAETRKMLKDEELAFPTVYNQYIADANIALSSKNPAQLAKILNGMVEKGLSTNESEIQAIVNKDAGQIKRWYYSTYGTPAEALKSMHSDIMTMAKGRQKRSQSLIDSRSGGAPKKETKAERRARLLAKYGAK